MSKAGRKKETDSDVLRASDIVPPYESNAGAAGKNTSRKKASAPQKTGLAKGKHPAPKSAAGEQRGGDIPQLDLNKQILAKQRKVTSVRRKGPGAKDKAPIKAAEIASGGIAGVRAVPELAEQDQVIAEIVARDIRRLCEG
jgi:hypothetical protein